LYRMPKCGFLRVAYFPPLTFKGKMEKSIDLIQNVNKKNCTYGLIVQW
jgi:hypothetical protein